MSVSDEYGERFKQAKEVALQITDLIEEGDEAFLIRLSEVPFAIVNPATHDAGLLKKIITESTISAVHKSIPEALNLSAKLLNQSSNANKEIYVITDRQKTLFSTATLLNDSISLQKNQVQLFFVPIGSNPIANTSIDSLSILSTIFEKDKPISLYISVKNFSPTPLKNYVISAYLEGKHLSQNSVDIDPWSSKSLEISVLPKLTGFVKGYIEIEDDAIEMDNRRYFTLSIPEKINVGLISSSLNDSRFIRTALEARNNQNEAPIAIQDIQLNKFKFTNLDELDVIIIVNVTSFSENDCTRLKDFIEQGKGLIIFPGPGMDINNYNRDLLTKLEIPKIENITGNILQPANLNFDSYDLDHPLFENIFESNQKSDPKNKMDSPSITTALIRKADKKSFTIISMNNGFPALTEHTRGAGKILFWSISPNLDWSDFPIKGLFAPLMYRSVIYSSPKEESNLQVMAGKEIILPIAAKKVIAISNDKNVSAPYKIIAPDKIEEIITRMGSDTANIKTNKISYLELKNLNQTGIYEVQKGSQVLAMISVNTNPQESDTRFATVDEMQTTAENFGLPSSNIHFAKSRDQLKTSILQTRFGAELWQYCIIIAVILALVEILIARDSRSNMAQP